MLCSLKQSLILGWIIVAIDLPLVFSRTDNFQQRSFTIDYERDAFVRDGKLFRYISGSIHYARVPFQMWEDRLQKMAAAGLDAIQVYIPWNIHEPEPGVYSFNNQTDVLRFLDLAQRHNLLVILRPGPYICGEWEYGGFPYWLKMHNESIILRSMDPGYIEPVARWFSVLLPMLRPLLYNNGGPIIMVQIENEYGSYSSVDCGHDYMAYLRDLVRDRLGNNIQLFTTDGAGSNYLKCGAINGTYATVDFGPGNAHNGFLPMRSWNPIGPLVNSEYYTGWLDYWNGTWARTSTDYVIKTLQDMLNMGGNVNMYMFEGGTNFGFMNGADPVYQPVTTSYDYDSPLTEAGDTTPKYMAIRELISKYKSVPDQVPPNSTKAAYGTVFMREMVSISEAVESTSRTIISEFPITMEQAKQAYGFALYRTVLPRSVESEQLSVPGIRDRGYVSIDGIPKGVLYRNGQVSMMISGRDGQTLDILVENMGRTNYGSVINYNRKGIIYNVTLGGVILTDWEYFVVDVVKISFKSGQNFKSRSLHSSLVSNLTRPTVYQGEFVLGPHDKPADSFLNMCGWTKGVVYVNGFNLGRYWPTLGPQVTLYMPSTVVKPYPTANNVTVLELEHAPCRKPPGQGSKSGGQRTSSEDPKCRVESVEAPILGAKCNLDGKLSKLPIVEVNAMPDRRRGVGL